MNTFLGFNVNDIQHIICMYMISMMYNISYTTAVMVVNEIIGLYNVKTILTDNSI